MRKKADADSPVGGTISSKQNMKPADPNGRTPFGDLTNIQMSGTINFFLLVLNKLFHKYPLSFWIVLFFLEDVPDH
jgi:hypothetical protein